ncbi:hypothetical protein SAY87_024364 [Trapa incisa]|uniref:Uncharacterized protein n=2 Tax=Trapa TaxID=22665 RepID=A0AAN7R4P3_TRANT|nr:hypothetical protein SAY87_024364 [Trapa incisa]KAK4788090.1 hypothetical protein SAY86_019409 [Trapa natans]
MAEASTTIAETSASTAPEGNPNGGTMNSATKSIAEIAEDVQRTVVESRDSAIRSARNLQRNSSTLIQSLQVFGGSIKSEYHTYEDAFVDKVKDELKNAREHPGEAIGLSLAAGLLLLRGPRRFLFRQTIGRLQSEETQFVKAEKSVKDLGISVDLMKNESKKLLERTALAEKDMSRGISDLRNAGSQIQRLAKSAYKVETQASGLMNDLREIPGRDALKLRAEVASMLSHLKQQRMSMEKRILKISELGVAV